MVNYFVDPTAGYDPGALSGLAQTVGQVRQRMDAQKEKKRQGEELKFAQNEAIEAFRSRDPNRVAEVSIKYPAFRESLMQAFNITSPKTEGIAKEAYRRLLTDPGNAAQYLQDGIDEVRAAGGSPDTMTKDLQMLQQNPEGALENIGLAFAGMAPEEHKALTQEKEKFKMGSGPMAGYAFDEATGQYSIDPEIKTQLIADAEKKAAKTGMLTSKEVAGVNDKITALISDVSGAYNAAIDLQKLEEGSSPTDQLAAIFKFMKSLDPTSVVREGEQAMAQRTGGPADAFIGYVNQLQGEGKLTPTAFGNMVNTAVNLANSAVDTGNEAVTSYLSVLDDKISARDLTRLQNRVPKRIVVSAGQPATAEDDQALEWARNNPDDPRAQRILNLRGQ